MGRWIQASGHSAIWVANEMRRIATKTGLRPTAAPSAKTLLDAVNGRHRPSLVTVLLARMVTDGQVDVQHWVSDLFC